jgi:hypothetical protein
MTQSATTSEGYSKTGHWLADGAPNRPASVTILLLILIRHTAGWQRDEVTLGIKQLADLCGLSIQGARNAVAYAIGAGIIEREPAGNNGFTYRVLGGSTECTPLGDQLSGGVNSVCEGDQLSVPQGVNSVYPYKDNRKKERKSRAFAATAASASLATDEPPHPAEATDRPVAAKISQTTLIGLPEQPPPGSAAPPPAAKARAPRKPKATPEQAAIRQALRDAAGWGPSAKANAQAAENGDALMALDPRATPERITRFARRYFPRHSPVARAAAARQDTVSHPTPGQVLQFWPGFQEWEQAQIAAAARQAEEQRPPERQEITPEQRAENRRILQEAMRSYGLDMAPAARPAMMAAPRRAT